MGAVNVRLPASCVGAASVRVVPPSTTSTSAIQRIISTLLFATGFSNGRKSKETNLLVKETTFGVLVKLHQVVLLVYRCVSSPLPSTRA